MHSKTKEEPNKQLEAVIPDALAHHRLDKAMAQLFPEYSRSQLTRWIQDKAVTVNQLPRPPRYKVQASDHIHLSTRPLPQANWEAEEPIDLNIVYEDQNVLVINKPPGLVVHPGNGNLSGTLVNALLYYDTQLKQLPRAGLIHRLDKDTSGLLIIARDLPSHHNLVKQLQARTIVRTYQAVVLGNFIGMRPSGTIEAPIGRHPKYRTRMAVFTQNTSNSMPSGTKSAITHYKVLKNYPHHSLLEVTLETGRTHQIRAHMSHIKHPVLGDGCYGGRKDLAPLCPSVLIDRQALHACQLTFTHPNTREQITCKAPLPKDIKTILQHLKML